MTGSLRQRGRDTWELRVYLGVDHDSGRERRATNTVHGSRRHANARLGEFVEDAGYARLRAGTVADLLDRWMGHASPAWSSTTLAQTRSIVEHHLEPLLGEVRVNKLTTIDIDDMYRWLSRCGSSRCSPGTASSRCHGCLDGSTDATTSGHSSLNGSPRLDGGSNPFGQRTAGGRLSPGQRCRDEFRLAALKVLTLNETSGSPS